MPIIRLRASGLLATWLSIFLLLAGCAVQLAPNYDKAVADGLNAASTETMVLMASASAGTRSTNFSARENAYNGLIGRLDALALLAAARPIPKNKVTETINKIFEKRQRQLLSDDDSMPPSAHAIEYITSTVTKMRDTDRKQGLTETDVRLFKGQVTIFFDQAMTYENFLQR